MDNIALKRLTRDKLYEDRELGCGNFLFKARELSPTPVTPFLFLERPFEHFACAADGQFVDVCDDSHAQSERWQVISIKWDKLMELAEDDVGVDCPSLFAHTRRETEIRS